jgi:hypothetical protein
MSRRAFIHGLGAAILCAGMATPALAQPKSPVRPPPGSPLSKFLGSREAGGPQIARYVAGDLEFVLDRSGPQPLIQFRGGTEILALTRSAGPRNDEIYKNDIGEQVLRMSSLGGGGTIYTPDQPQGMPVSLVQVVVTPIRLPVISGGDIELGRRELQASLSISTALQRHVGFQIAEYDSEAWALVGDTINLVVKAIQINQEHLRQNPKFSHIDRVLIVVGDQPGILLNYDTIQITVAPSKGPAGRPSSARIAIAMMR